MGAIVIRTRYDEGTESAEVATSEVLGFSGMGRTREGTRLQDHLCALC
jgi:hypothetical protein